MQRKIDGDGSFRKHAQAAKIQARSTITISLLNNNNNINNNNKKKEKKFSSVFGELVVFLTGIPESSTIKRIHLKAGLKVGACLLRGTVEESECILVYSWHFYSYRADNFEMFRCKSGFPRREMRKSKGGASGLGIGRSTSREGQS